MHGRGFGLDSGGIVMRSLHIFANDNINCRVCFSSIGILIGKGNVIFVM